MAAHTAVPVRGPRNTARPPLPARRPLPRAASARASRASWAVPGVLGLGYGIYTALVVRQSSPLTWGDAWLGIVCGVLLAAVAYLLGKAGRHLDNGPRSVSYAVLCGAAMGFLLSLSGASVLSSVVLGLVFFGGMFVAAYYTLYSHTP